MRFLANMGISPVTVEFLRGLDSRKTPFAYGGYLLDER